MDGDTLDLYRDCLLASDRKAAAVGLSELTGGAMSHDQITRFLAGEELNGKSLWLKIKKLARQRENGGRRLTFDDAIVEKRTWTGMKSPPALWTQRGGRRARRALYNGK